MTLLTDRILNSEAEELALLEHVVKDLGYSLQVVEEEITEPIRVFILKGTETIAKLETIQPPYYYRIKQSKDIILVSPAKDGFPKRLTIYNNQLKVKANDQAI